MPGKGRKVSGRLPGNRIVVLINSRGNWCGPIVYGEYGAFRSELEHLHAGKSCGCACLGEKESIQPESPRLTSPLTALVSVDFLRQ